MTLAGAVHKKRGSFFLVHKNDAKHTPQKKKHILQNKKKMEERTYEDILMEVLLELLFDRMAKEEMDLLRDQLVEFSGITVHYVMDLKKPCSGVRLYQDTAYGGDRLAHVQVVSDDIGRGGGEKESYLEDL